MSSTTMMFAAFCVLGLATQLTRAQVYSNACPQPGRYYNPNDCATYYECIQGRTVPFLKRCGPGDLYNHITQECDWVRNVDCSRNRQPVILSNPIPATLIRPIPSRVTVPITLTNALRQLPINSNACSGIALALWTTLRQQVALLDSDCRQLCLDALPRFDVICSQ